MNLGAKFKELSSDSFLILQKFFYHSSPGLHSFVTKRKKITSLTQELYKEGFFYSSKNIQRIFLINDQTLMKEFSSQCRYSGKEAEWIEHAFHVGRIKKEWIPFTKDSKLCSYRKLSSRLNKSMQLIWTASIKTLIK